MTHTHDSTTRVRYWADLEAGDQAGYDAGHHWTPSASAQQLQSPDETHPYNLVSSLLTNGLHSPAIDVDMAVEVIPSSTEGHFHLYFPDVEIPWERYSRLLAALKECGIITNGYYQHSVARRQTTLRPPHVKKTVVARRTRTVLDEQVTMPRSLAINLNGRSHAVPVDTPEAPVDTPEAFRVQRRSAEFA
jgi:hypothetical protein